MATIRRRKKIMPIVDKIKAIYPEIEKLTNDELRARIDAVRNALKESVAPQREKIAELKQHVETLEYEEREPVWEKIDKLEKEVLDVLEDKLDEVLPEVFAVVKDTARRFAQNERIEVTATQFDRDLGYMDNLLENNNVILSTSDSELLDILTTVYEQQRYMFENNTHTVENRIVSISQPYIRPIVRGKAKSPVEFGASSIQVMRLRLRQAEHWWNVALG